MTTPAGRPPGRKTYTRLAAGRRVPLEYELVSTDLHYNHPMRFELPAANPVIAWYYRYREGSPLQAREWQQFSDPRRTTYRAYTVLQDGREDVIDGLLREVDDTGYDRNLDQEWVRFLDRWYSPLRFPVHGLQMLAAYVAQMAPASRITNCAAFQSADELRRVQRIAYRTVQLSGPPLETGAARQQQAAWEDAAAFQPLRELIERALVAYDWGEAFTVTNLVIKPRIDRLVNQEIAGTLATANGDPILASIHFSLDEDARWHRAWTTALLRYLVDDTPANAEMVSGWIEKVEPARFPGLGSPRRDPRRGTCTARRERGNRPHHQRRVAGHRLSAAELAAGSGLLGGYAGELDARADAEFPEDVAQVKGHGVGAQEDPAGHLAVAEPLGHQVSDGAFGVGQALPAEGRTVRVGPVAEPGADGAQPGSHPGRALGRAELLVEVIRLPQHGLRAALVALADPGAAGIFHRGSAGTGSRVADRHPLQERGVLIDKPAGVVGGGRHVRVVRRGRGQPPRRVGQVLRPFGVAFGQRAADQQDRALRIGDPAAEQGQLQVLL